MELFFKILTFMLCVCVNLHDSRERGRKHKSGFQNEAKVFL